VRRTKTGANSISRLQRSKPWWAGDLGLHRRSQQAGRADSDLGWYKARLQRFGRLLLVEGRVGKIACGRVTMYERGFVTVSLVQLVGVGFVYRTGET
jgi:hypothetical protein